VLREKENVVFTSSILPFTSLGIIIIFDKKKIVTKDNNGHVKEIAGTISTVHEGRGKTVFIPLDGEGIISK
jgi:hypothetical protein